MVHAPKNGIQRRITTCTGKYGMLEDEGLHQLTSDCLWPLMEIPSCDLFVSRRD